MVFSSLTFIYIFLPAVMLCYFVVPKKALPVKNTVLLVFSLLFYFAGEPKYIILMTASILACWLFALLIYRSKTKSARKLWLIISATLSLGALGIFKYTNFAISGINTLFGASLPLCEIALPVGISFFTFQGLSYVIDVYRGTVPAQKNIINVATYISLFPQLVAGPIVRYETIESELSNRHADINDMARGIRRFIFGLSKKMLIANSLGALADEIFALDGSCLSTPLAWLGAIAYSLQIFFDFSGYSDMAIGMGGIFGFHFLENFDYPYISASITEFWRRWHISLGSWFRDYLYIPLGGNKKGKLRQILNILIVWSLTGLWHGASMNFVVWGLYFAVILICEKLFLSKLLSKLPKAFSHIYALLLIAVGWVIFSSETLAGAFEYIGIMFSFKANVQSSGNSFVYYLCQYGAELALGIFFSVPVVKKIGAKFDGKPLFELARNTAALLLLVLSTICIVNTSFNPFIYFRF